MVAKWVVLGLLAFSVVGTIDGADHDLVWVWSDPSGTGDRDGLLELLERRGLPHHALPGLGMVTFAGTSNQAAILQESAGGRIDPDARFRVSLDRSVPYIGAHAVQAAQGPMHDGPTVLVVDTGLDSLHPDFGSDNLAANVQPIRQGGLVVGSTTALPVVDFDGHGTHVAGIVAGSGKSLGASDPLHGDFRGVYTNGRVASYQAGSAEDEEGGGSIELVAVLEGYQWAIDNQEAYDIRVISNSWGANGSFDPDHPLEEATLILYKLGFTVVFAAGNEGEDGPGTLNPHCVAPWVLCVAAGDLAGKRASFSSQGNATRGLPYDHPDITAPGILIKSTVPTTGSTMDMVGNLAASRPASEALYGDKSGTSMATPHVAGAAGLLLAARPDLSPDEVMEILVASAAPMTEPLAQAGTGYLDVDAAFALAGLAVGHLEGFLAGSHRYAGPDSGDPAYARDATTYQPQRPGAPPDPTGDASHTTSPSNPAGRNRGTDGQDLGTSGLDPSDEEAQGRGLDSPEAGWLALLLLVALALHRRL